jgi:predicted phosphodiesterase
MRVAAFYDIHSNLPALEAVLQDVREAEVDQIVIGGDVLPGPMPRETLKLLLELDRPVHFIHGNGELAVLAQIAAQKTGIVTYWGTTSGNPLPEPLQEVYRWTAQQIQPEFDSVIASWPKTLRLAVDGLGDVLFCHGTPRSETEIFTRLTPADRLVPFFDGLNAAVVVCGHTHMQFDRMIGRTRVVNAGSIGEPFGKPGAFWALLGPDVELRYTSYDLTQAAERILAVPHHPQAQEAARDILHPPAEQEMLEVFGKAELR